MRQPDEPCDVEEYRFPGSPMNPVHTWATWALGLFGMSIIVMLGFVLNSLYTVNGDQHELKGQVLLLQGEVSAMQLQLNNFYALNDGRTRQ